MFPSETYKHKFVAIIGTPHILDENAVAMVKKGHKRSDSASGRFVSALANHFSKATAARERWRSVKQLIPVLPTRSKRIEAALSRLLVYDVLVLLAQYLHTYDLVNLSLVSKRIRNTMFHPSDPTGSSMAALQHFACSKPKCKCSAAHNCAHCRIRVCHGCMTKRLVPRTRTEYHQQYCRPVCSKCRRREEVEREWRRCNCGDGRRARQRDYIYDGDLYIDSHLCRDCDYVTDEALKEVRETRAEERLLDDVAAQERVGCVRCGNDVAQAVWWICYKCNGECKANCHLKWRKQTNVNCMP